MYEISALCNVLQCKIRSICPHVDVRDDTAIINNNFMPSFSIVANCEIRILWSHTLYENEARAANNSMWSPNHFVPLLSPSIQRGFNDSNQPLSILAVSFHHP